MVNGLIVALDVLYRAGVSIKGMDESQVVVKAKELDPDRMKDF